MFIESTRYQRVINRLAFALLCLVPLAIFPDGHRFNVAISKFVFLAVISLVFLALIIVEKRWNPRLDQPENRWLAIYVGLLGISTIFALDPMLAILGSEARWDGLITFSFYLVAYAIGRNLRVKEKFLKAIMVTTLIVSVYALLQLFKIDPPFLRLYATSWRGLAFSTMGNPNFLGSYLVLFLPVPIYFYLIKHQKLSLGLYAITYFALLATRTRGAWIGGAIGFLIMVTMVYFQSEDRKLALKRIIILGLISILLFGVFMVVSDDTMMNKLLAMFTDIRMIITDPEDAERAGSNRFYIWQRSVELIKQRPIFGYGVENMSLAMSRNFRDKIVEDFGRFRNWDKAHNEYLNIAVASGIPSLIAYLGFTGLAIRKGFRKRKDCPMMLPFIAAAGGYMVQAFFNIQMIIVYYGFMATLGILASDVFCLPEPVVTEEVTEEESDGGVVYLDDHDDGLSGQSDSSSEPIEG